MTITHFALGFIISYLGFTPPSMLNLTVSKITLEEDKYSAFQFTLGAALVVFMQFFLSFLIVSLIHRYPDFLFWIKNVSIVVFVAISIFFLTRGVAENIEKDKKNYRNNFIYGVSLSFINMFAIPFFAVSYSLLLVEGLIDSESMSLLVFAIGLFFGTIAILMSYILLMKKLENKIIVFTKFYNPFIGIVTGFFAIYSVIKLYL